jgi:hypothetical protein
MTPDPAIPKPRYGVHHLVMAPKVNLSDKALTAPKRCPGCLLCLRAGLWRAPGATNTGTPRRAAKPQ